MQHREQNPAIPARLAMTIIEVLVASVLLGVGVVGLMSAGTLALRNQHRSANETSALYLAQEKLAEIEVIGAHIWMLGHPTDGTVTRQGVRYQWTIEIHQQAVGEMFTVAVKVNWRSNGASGAVELETWLNDYKAKAEEAPEQDNRPGADMTSSAG